MKAVPIDDTENIKPKQLRAVPVDNEWDNPAPKSVSGMPNVKKTSGMTEFLKNSALGVPARFEEAAAGLAGPIATKSWLDKIARQKQWGQEHPESQIGNMIADIGMSAPMSLATPEVAGANALTKILGLIGKDATSGAALGYATNPGDSSDRIMSGIIGGIGGGLGSVAGQALKGIVKGVGGAVRTLVPTEEGHAYAISNLLKTAIPPEHVPMAKYNLEHPEQFVPGYKPTAAEAGYHTGLNALQKFIENINPGKYASREYENTVANNEAVKRVSQTDSIIRDAIKNRKAITSPMYKIAEKQNVEITPDLSSMLRQPNMTDALDKTLITLKNKGISVPPNAKQNILSGLTQTDTGFFDSHGKPIINTEPTQISGQHIDLLKKSMDKMLKDPNNSMDEAERIAHENTIKRFEQWREDNFPVYNEAKNIHRQMSIPINQMKIGRTIQKAGYPSIDEFGKIIEENPNSFASALLGPKTVKQATKITGSVEKQLTPKQNNILNNVAKNMNRREFSKIGTGGDFGTNQQSFLARLPGAVVGQVANIPGAYQFGAAHLYDILNKSSKEVKSQLADILLNPKITAQYLKMGDRPPVASFMEGNKRNAIPGIMGYVAGQELNR